MKLLSTGTIHIWLSSSKSIQYIYTCCRGYADHTKMIKPRAMQPADMPNPYQAYTGDLSLQIIEHPHHWATVGLAQELTIQRQWLLSRLFCSIVHPEFTELERYYTSHYGGNGQLLVSFDILYTNYGWYIHTEFIVIRVCLSVKTPTLPPGKPARWWSTHQYPSLPVTTGISWCHQKVKDT